MSRTVRTRPVRIEQTGQAETDARTVVKIAGHDLVIDEPENRHGTDRGPTPVDTMVAGLAGCTNVILNKIAAEMKIEIRDLRMRIEGDLETQGILGFEENRRPIPALDLRIEFGTDASEEQIDALREQLHQRCPVSVVFREAGIDIREDWQVAHD